MARVSFNINEVKRVVEYAKKHNLKMALVKDQGLYIMAMAKKDTPKLEGGHIVYAKGFNPETDANWYDEAHYKFGGDDFVDYPPIKDWYEALTTNKPNAKVFAINIGTKNISLIQ
jgi:hypothetical protein